MTNLRSFERPKLLFVLLLNLLESWLVPGFVLANDGAIAKRALLHVRVTVPSCSRECPLTVRLPATSIKGAALLKAMACKGSSSRRE